MTATTDWTLKAGNRKIIRKLVALGGNKLAENMTCFVSSVCYWLDRLAAAGFCSWLFLLFLSFLFETSLSVGGVFLFLWMKRKNLRDNIKWKKIVSEIK